MMRRSDRFSVPHMSVVDGRCGLICPPDRENAKLLAFKQEVKRCRPDGIVEIQLHTLLLGDLAGGRLPAPMLSAPKDLAR